MQSERILVVEDEPVVALDLRQTLERLGHEVCGTQVSADGAVSAARCLNPSLILMDIHLDGERDGIDACKEIYEELHLPVIYLTAFADDATVGRAAATKPFGYVTKPFDPRELTAVIQVARLRYETERALIKSETRLTLAIQAAELGIWEWESQLDQLNGDERFNHIWGAGLCPFKAGMAAMLDRIHPDDRTGVGEMLASSGFFHCVFRAYRDNGEIAWLEMYGHLRREVADTAIVVGALRDITQRKQMEEALRRASVVFDAAAEGILILDDLGAVLTVNAAFCRLTGYAINDVLGRRPNEFLLVRRESDPDSIQMARENSGHFSSEVACRCKDGRIFPALQHLCVVDDIAGVPTQYVQMLSDISAIREAEHQLMHLAYHDPLTGLGNRYLLDKRLGHEMELAKASGHCLAVIFIDLDGFKSINDSMGHHIGDRVIQEAARRISQVIRHGDEAIRLGGDEFVVVLPALHQGDEAMKIGQKLLSTIAKAIHVDELQFVIGASIGVATFPTDGKTMHDLLSAADSAMYEAKRRGKGCVCAYSRDLVENVRNRLNIEQSLYGALERGEFVLNFQPVVDLYESRLAGFEALIRWQHPVYGLVNPDKFIPVAEETGMIDAIGAWVLDQAAAQLTVWKRHGAKDLFMAVNASARQFRNDGFLAQVATIIDRYELESESLEIEITESILQDFHHSRRVVLSLRELGVNVAIDDFGTGFSSLSLLKHLPITRIKIDRSFVIALPGTARDVGLISAMMQMANSLELGVTAEGIETAEQSKILSLMGRPAVQGYYFGRPALPSAFPIHWLLEKCKRGAYDDLG
ncbi:EAL domain-containing protein [Chitinimonas sp.]|uniref:two-component system response regulator n=1 Tax=Chitinimonas sp. TaxID=1934313 RepID=UPI0035B16D71